VAWSLEAKPFVKAWIKKMWSRIAVFVLGQKYSYAKEFKLMNQSFHAQPALTKGFKKKH